MSALYPDLDFTNYPGELDNITLTLDKFPKTWSWETTWSWINTSTWTNK